MNKQRRGRWRTKFSPRWAILTFGLMACAITPRWAAADDPALQVARARAQVEGGSYAEAMKTLRALPTKGVPVALVVEAALLETTATLVTSSSDAAESACGRAVVASGYDPEVARDQSPKVRKACRSAAVKERGRRLALSSITFGEVEIERPEVAWQPARIAVRASSVPSWLQVVVRITSNALEGSFDLSLAPSVEGPLRGTLDPSWIRPQAEMKVELVPQDKYGDLGPAVKTATMVVPAAEAMLVLGELPPSSSVTIDREATRPSAGGRVPVAPGRHAVALTLEDGSFASTTIDVKQGAVARVALSPQKRTPGRTLAWIATGTSVAMTAVGGVLLLTANIRRAEIEDLSAKREEGTDLPATEYSDIKSRDQERKTFATAGAAMLIGGGVVGVGALALWLWPSSTTPAKSGRLTPLIGPGHVGLAGHF